MSRVTLTKDQYDDLVDTLEMSGLINEARSNYSGRGMYGKECIGFVTDLNFFEFGLKFAAELVTLNEDNSEFPEYQDFNIEDFYDSRTDSMGLSSIVYFPGITVEK